MGNWNALTDELDRWAGNGRAATLWWRDDDTVRPTGALDRLLALRAQTQAPLALAVIPATVEPATAAHIDPGESLDVLQHGYIHRNHAPPGERKAELGPGRPSDHHELDERESTAEPGRGESLSMRLHARLRPVGPHPRARTRC